MDIQLPERITKKIANQARMTVASVLNYEKKESEAIIACYESIAHELLEPFRTPWSADKKVQPDRERELYELLRKKFGGDKIKYDRRDRHSSEEMVIEFGLGARVFVSWNKYSYYFEMKFSSSWYIYPLDFSYADFINALPTIDFIINNLPSWQPIAEECIRDYRKKQKISEIKATAVKSFATQKLSECGLPYRLEQGKLRDKVFFKISDKDMAMFYLSHKNFDTAIDKIIAAAKQIAALVKEVGLQISIRKIGDHNYFENDKK